MADGRVPGYPQYSQEEAEAAIARRGTGLPSGSFDSIFNFQVPEASPSGLVTRGIQTVPIDPSTGMPIARASTPITQKQQQAIRDVQAIPSSYFTPSTNTRSVSAPGVPNGSVLAGKESTRFPVSSGNADLLTGYGPTPTSRALTAINDAVGYSGPTRWGNGPFTSLYRSMEPFVGQSSASLITYPGRTDWSVANQGMDGLGGDVRAGNNAQGQALRSQQQAIAQALMGQTPVQQLQAQGLSPSQAYTAAIQQEQQRAIANSSNPSANASRASLASQWGFD